MRLPRTLAAAIAAALLLTAACGSDDDEPEAADDTTTTTEAVDDDTTTTTEGDEEPDETTTTAGSEGTDPLEELARSLLVTIDELGMPDFQDAGYTPDQGPNQCGYDLDAEHPADVQVGTTLGNDQLAFEQEIRVYPSEQEAAAAFEDGVANSTCGDLPDGTTFTEPADVTAEVGGDQAIAINATNPSLQAVVIAVLLSDSVVSFTFASAPGAAEAQGAPQPIAVAAYGVGKIEAALEG